jgi:hypothetical protein
MLSRLIKAIPSEIREQGSLSQNSANRLDREIGSCCELSPREGNDSLEELEPRSRHAERICFEEVLRGRAYLARRTRYSLLVSSSTISLREQDLGRESSEFWWVGNVPSYNLNPDNNSVALVRCTDSSSKERGPRIRLPDMQCIV